MKVSVIPSDDSNSISGSSYDIKAPIIILVANGPVEIRLEYFPVTKSSKTGRKVVPFVVRDVFFFWTTLVFCGQGEAAKYIQSSVLLQPSYFCL